MLPENCDLISGLQQLAGKILSARELAQRFSASFYAWCRQYGIFGNESKGWMNIEGVEKVGGR
jgi:hypothetical protein